MGIHPADQQVTAKHGVDGPTTLSDNALVVLRAIVEGTAGSTGAVFESLAGHLATAFGGQLCLVAESAGLHCASLNASLLEQGADPPEILV
jgi:hypothetical protein